MKLKWNDRVISRSTNNAVGHNGARLLEMLNGTR